MAKVRISHIISDSNIGGAGILLSSLTHAISEIFDISVFIPKGARLKASLEESGTRVFELPMAADKSFSAGDVQGFFSVFRDYPADIVHTHGALSARLGARLAGIKACLSTRHCALPSAAVKKKNRLIRGVYDYCTDLTVSTADYATENLVSEGVSRSRIVTIKNGVTAKLRTSPEEREKLRALLGIPKGAAVLGICSRLEWIKGIDLVISAMPEILKAHPDTYLVIIGEGSQREALMRQSARLGVLDFVRFCGFKEDPTPYQSIFDININASRGTETSCLATSECMSMGIPTLASDFGGNTEMIIPYENGTLFRCDSVFSLIEGALELLSDRELIEELSRGALGVWQRSFSLERMKSDYISLYNRIAKESSVGKRIKAH